jgi:hypothetical protein
LFPSANCPLSPAGKTEDHLKHCLDSVFALLGKTFHQNASSRFLKNAVSGNMNGREGVGRKS